MTSGDRWTENWRTVAPPGAVHIELGRTREPSWGSLRHDIAPGTHVVVSASAPRAARRCRRFAAASGIALEREFLAYPSARAPAYLVEDARVTVAQFAERCLVAPPRVPFATVVDRGVALVRLVRAWWLVRLLAPGRVVVGKRS
jgi:hypothetical protein